ncbi:MAG: amidophosphoribosyltransferase [Bdellovibrionaceae bacterium]|nr:amidophosphoribosyltransferase [Pseudobdellovibrionaceae bacterium]
MKQRHWREECGVIGIWNSPDAARLAYLGLYAMQHRGQESAGIVSLHQGKHITHKGLGLVGEVFQDADLERLTGRTAIGHVRYSTTGENLISNAQPLTATLFNGPVAVAHNGNIVNSEVLRQELKRQGSIFHATSDTEIILHLISKNPSDDLLVSLKESLHRLEGAFSLMVLSKDIMVAARDPLGFRPLVLGRKENEDGSWARVVASESCAFDLIGAEYDREVKPGEIFWVDASGEHSELYAESPRTAHCIFEHIYFARPDSVVFGESVYGTRKAFGRQLAKENPVEADVVIPVPDSGVAAALGYSMESGIPFELGIIRNHYVGRTFIQPQQSIRDFGVKIKLNPQSAVLKDKRVIVIDDSLVRGTTSRKIINLIRQAGAREVHLKIAAPPTTGPCHYGVDTPQKAQLIAAQQSIEQIRSYVGADSLSYLSIEGLFKAINRGHNEFCAACFDGKYPTPLFGHEAGA